MISISGEELSKDTPRGDVMLSADLSDEKQMMLPPNMDLKTYEVLMQERKTKKEMLEQNTANIGESQTRKWLVKHGKKHLISFDEKERYKLKQFFSSLDADGSGSIGTDELLDPFISLGIAENTEEVQAIVDSVDDDQSGQIEFKEFLKIIAGTQENKGDTAIIDFFKDMISGRLAGGKISNKLPFDLIISTVRRRKLMNAMMAGDTREKGEGEKVMNSYSKLVDTRKKEKTYLEPPKTNRSIKISRQSSATSEAKSQTSITSRSRTKKL